MHGKAEIKHINNNEAVTSPIKILDGVGIGSISDIPLVGVSPDGYEAVGAPVKATLDGSAFVESLDLAGTRAWIREQGVKFIGFTRQGATVGILQAFSPTASA